ncbi:MAG: PHP domain-containing protein [Planctomycetota bacterium]|jgi:histidinol phosphatase-like PHP family hydrolase
MTCPKYDFHIHTKHMGCANATMEVAAIASECRRLGLCSIAMTDHMYGPQDLERHARIRRDIEGLAGDTELEVYFGVELNFIGRDEGFPFSREIKEEYGFQFALGGIHGTYLEQYDLRELVDIQHRHHLRTCEDPLVAVLVHPYWFGKGEFDRKGFPWFDSMKAVPQSYVRELGQAAKQTQTAIEINACAHFANKAHSDEFVKQYVDYLSIIAEQGASFSLGSDSHDIGNLGSIHAAWKVAEQLALCEERIWRPDCQPLTGGRAAGRE